MKIKKDFFMRDPAIVARELLGKVIVVNGLKARVVETEAYYDSEDPASRARQNGDLRQTMLMEARTVLVYGVHNNWLVNVVTGEKGKAAAVLLRAGEPLNFSGNCSGLGLLTRALGINKEMHKKEINSCVSFIDDKTKVLIDTSFRIGVSKDLDKKLRFFVKGNKFVSR